MTANTSIESIADAIKVIDKSMQQLHLLQEYNFNDPNSGKPAKNDLLEIAQKLIQASADIMRSSANL